MTLSFTHLTIAVMIDFSDGVYLYSHFLEFTMVVLIILDLLGNKRETESLHSKDFIISYQLSSIQIEVP
jgi:hypothetical protein